MEEQRKSKRAEKGEISRADKKMKRKRRAEAAEAEAVVAVEDEVAAAEADPPPTEEEVEEFFTILKRIKVAVKYFEKSASGSKDFGAADGKHPPTAEGEVADGGEEVGGKTVVENSNFDLNAVPEEEEE